MPGPRDHPRPCKSRDRTSGSRRDATALGTKGRRREAASVIPALHALPRAAATGGGAVVVEHERARDREEREGDPEWDDDSSVIANTNRQVRPEGAATIRREKLECIPVLKVLIAHRDLSERSAATTNEGKLRPHIWSRTGLATHYYVPPKTPSKHPRHNYIRHEQSPLHRAPSAPARG